MPQISLQDIQAWNQISGGTGGPGAHPAWLLRYAELLSRLTGNPFDGTVSELCYQAKEVVVQQYFSEGNHRTGVCIIHLGLLKSCGVYLEDIVVSTTYAFLDIIAYHNIKSEPDKIDSTLDKLCDFIGNSKTNVKNVVFNSNTYYEFERRIIKSVQGLAGKLDTMSKLDPDMQSQDIGIHIPRDKARQVKIYRKHMKEFKRHHKNTFDHADHI